MKDLHVNLGSTTNEETKKKKLPGRSMGKHLATDIMVDLLQETQEKEEQNLIQDTWTSFLG